MMHDDAERALNAAAARCRAGRDHRRLSLADQAEKALYAEAVMVAEFNQPRRQLRLSRAMRNDKPRSRIRAWRAEELKC